MVSDQEAEKYYAENYHNQIKGISLNINKQLKIDVQIACKELSRNLNKPITPSSLTRINWVKFIIEYKKNKG